MKTVFVLGAGASWHYGYPTGEGLINEIVSYCDNFEKFIDNMNGAFSRNQIDPNKFRSFTKISSFREKAKKLSKKIKATNPSVIDYFLAHNSEYSDIANIMIAWCLLERERSYYLQNVEHAFRENPNNRNNKNDWVKFILHELLMGCEKFEDLVARAAHVNFLTFNYDISLEIELLTRLSQYQSMASHPNELINLIQQMVHHVYGRILVDKNSEIEKDALQMERLFDPFNFHLKLSRSPMSELGFLADYNYLEFAMELSKFIKTIAPAQKQEDLERCIVFKRNIQVADQIYILGYGFDKLNNELIGLNQIKSDRASTPRTVHFTNFKGTRKINKRILPLLPMNPERARNDVDIWIFNTGGHAQISTSDCYGALAEDFDFNL